MVRNRQKRTGVGRILLIVVSCGASVTLAQEAPFVPAFDRFGRHGEIDAVTSGRLLLTELSCTACHVSDDRTLVPKRGPRLDGAGSRLHAEWLTGFLADPARVKPGTTMPAMLSAIPPDEKAEVIEALVAFLQSQTQTYPDIKGSGARPVPDRFWEQGNAEEGRRLFHQIGCVACHAADESWETAETKPTPLDDILEQLDPDELEEAGLLSAARRVESVPLGDPAAKYSSQSLTWFLLKPHDVRPAGRMPDFQLGVVEAADIAAWLLQQSATEPTDDLRTIESTGDLIDRGRRLFTELGCANCHDVDDLKPNASVKPLVELDGLSDRQCPGEGQRGIPQYGLDAAQQEAVRAALKEPDTSNEDSGSDVGMTLLQLNCVGCHERDGKGGVGRYRKAYCETVGHVDIGDEGRLPPPLTGVGRKLTAKWMTRVLEGKGQLRGHMRIRMPVFAAHTVKALPRRFAAVDSPAQPLSEQDVFGSPDGLTEPGRQLLDTGCVQCHPLRGEAVPGVVGIDLEGVPSRVRPDWFHDFVLNPGELKPHTRMPSFFPRGQSQNRNILEGNTERQIAAMWTYLKGLSRNRLPAKIEQARSQSYELKPVDRPVLLRTFMEQVGTHAIAVGFPEQVHFAFDAEQVRLAQAWRGRFVDAQGTWFVRFAPPAQPLGTDVVNLPLGPDLAWLDEPTDVWPSHSRPGSNVSSAFRGYRLDDRGLPVFLYRIGPLNVEDSIQPDEGGGLRRRLSLALTSEQPAERSLWLRVLSGSTLKRLDSSSVQSETGLQVSIDERLAEHVRLRTHGDSMDWIVPLPADSWSFIEVRYQW